MVKSARSTGWFKGGPGVGWVGGYLVVSWGALQVTETVASLLGLPLWFGKAVLALLAVGLALVMVTAWLQGQALAVVATTGATPSIGARERLRRTLTWQRIGVVGVAAFALLGAGTAGHLGARALGVGPAGTVTARGLLPEHPELVLADLEDHAGDPAMARAATEALRVHLSQSPTIRLVPTPRVRAALERMAAPNGVPLDLATARELAVREGLVAVVGGEIHRVGSGNTVSIRLVAAESGAELVAALETARKPDDVVEAVDRLSMRLRERMGESLRSVRQSPPLGQVRTASLPALKSYTEAVDANGRGEFERCALLMDEAIAMDTAFAMAYEGRAVCNQNLGRNLAQQIADRVRAYEMRHRMTEEERLRITAVYHHFIMADRLRAIETWEAYSARYPDRPSPLFNLANLYAEGRDWERAEATLLRGLELSPTSVVVLINLAGYQTNLGRFDDAAATFVRLEQQAPGMDLAWRRATLSLARGDWDGARRELDSAREQARGNPRMRAVVATLQSYLARITGDLAEAERYLEEAMAADLETGDVTRYHSRATVLAEIQLRDRGDTTRALAIMEDALNSHPPDALDPLERGYLGLAEFYAVAGRPERARGILAEYEREVAPLSPSARIPHGVLALIAEAEGRLDQAVSEWRLHDELAEDPLPALAHLGALFDRTGDRERAIDHYRRYLTTPSRLRYESDPSWRARIEGRLRALGEEVP